MRESWTDDRLDYLNRRVEDGFARVDERFDQAERRVDEKFKRVDEQFKHVDEQFKRVDERFDDVNRRFEEGGARMARIESQLDHLSTNFFALNRTIMQFGYGMIATVLVGFLAILATNL